MWAIAVYNQHYQWVEVWKEMPIFDEVNGIYYGDGYLCSWAFPEVSLEIIDRVRERGPLLVSVNVSFGFWASDHDVQSVLSYSPRMFKGKKVNNE